ncbi:MAG TPA: protein kinase, partial [Vicinamibacterales bacterium]|nr:protein kinase [Vicinamibacterales bacterium]
MAIASGTRLGSYEVVSPLGAGGMGEVYRAVDTRLKRQVALKILPPSFAADAERLARFQREAELLAALNHPNIAAVYGIEDTSAGKALVMELVEGVDLRDRIARSPLPIAETLNLAKQLAQAIGAAHERGIVHRDLKPGNIRVRPDRTIKVLDFGIARALGQTDGHESVTVTATAAGTIVGTPRYMSPEQARGEVAGPQTDVWAFGVILYEMLTGRAPFDAPSSVETLSRVLSHEPDFTQLPPSLDPRVRLLVQRCLRKTPAQRLHHIGDAAIELEDAASAPVDAPAPARSSRWPLAVAAAAIVAASGIAGWAWLTRGNDSAARVMLVDVSAPVGPAIAPMGARRVAISRDGQRIAISTRTGLYIRRLNEAEFVTIPGAPLNPFFSPDGRWVAYFDAGESGAGLKIVATAGGTPRMVAPTAERSAGGDWREDGTIVFATASGLYTVRDDGSQLRTLAKPDATARERILAFPQFLPGSNAVLFTSTSMDTSARLLRIDLETLAVEVLLHGGSSARYLPDGRLVYAARDRLRVVRFDPRRPSISPDSTIDTGVALPVALDNGAADFAISDAGDLVYQSPAHVVRLTSRLVWVDRQGRREPIDLPAQTLAYPRVSPDGSRITMDSNVNGNRDVWIYDLRQRRLSQLTFGPTEDNQPVWSGDGKRVFFASDRTGDFDIYSRAADGATDDRLELAAPRIQFPASVTPDGTGIFVIEDYVDTSLLRLPGPQRVEPVLHGPSSERLAVLSPDGKWLAYESTESGLPAVFVRPFPNVSERREQVSPSGGRYPLWNPAGNGELFFVT